MAKLNSLPLNELSDAVDNSDNVEISKKVQIVASDITIIKRKGHKEPFQPEKLRKVCLWACENDEDLVEELLEDTLIKLHKEIDIKDMYQQLITTAVNKISMLYPEWEDIAAKLQLLSIYKETYNISNISEYTHLKEVIEKGVHHKIYDKNTISSYTDEEIEQLNKAIDPSRDYLFNYKSLITFFDKYCLNYTKTKTLELPQHAYMRIAMCLMAQERNRVEEVIKEYNNLSLHNYTRATPIALNSLTPGQQLSSCVLNTLDDDSHNILDTGKNLGIYSKFKGGTALDISALRANGGYIEGTQGYSSGPVPFMKFFESIMKAWNQGGKRPGALAIYFNWWHLNSLDLLSLKSNGGTDENRARGLQYAVKVNKFFLDAVINDETITLFDPKETPKLIGLIGDEFKEMYDLYNNKTNIRKKRVRARDLIAKIFKERSETGNIYLFHDDNINEQTLLNRYIGSSNLCLSGDTKIFTDRGYKELKDAKIGDMVKSYNTVTKNVEMKKITDFAMTSPKAKVMKITDDVTGKYIICTPDHEVWTENRGYIEAKYLTTEDILNIS